MNDQELKPALCILNPDDVYNLQNNYAEDSYYCITPYEALELQRKGVSFPVDPHLQEGLILTLEPNKQGYYFRTDETDSRVINERCLAIEAILSYLGGKEFHYSETSSFRSKQLTGIDVEGEVKKGGVKVDNKTSVESNIAQGESGDKKVVAQWSGNYTKEGYSRAVELAKANGLINDPTIASLLEMRLPTHPNPIASQEYHVNVTADLDKSIYVLEDISANLQGVIGGNLKVDVNTSRKMDQSSTVDFFVSFGPIPQAVMQKAIEERNRTPHKVRSTKWGWIALAAAVVSVAVTLLLILL